MPRKDDLLPAVKEILAHNRGLSALDKARLAGWLLSHRYGDADLRKAIQDRLGDIDPSTLRRYARVLRAPEVVQAAFGRGDLAHLQAAKVAGLSRETQAAIAKRIIAGESPAAVVAEYIRPPETRRKYPAESYYELIADIAKKLPIITAGMDRVPGPSGSRHRELLADMVAFARRQLKRPDEPESDFLRDLRLAHEAEQKSCSV